MEILLPTKMNLHMSTWPHMHQLYYTLVPRVPGSISRVHALFGFAFFGLFYVCMLPPGLCLASFFWCVLCAHVTPSGYPPTAIGYPPTAIGYPPTAIVGRIGHSQFFFFVTAPPGGTADGLHDTHGRVRVRVGVC